MTTFRLHEHLMVELADDCFVGQLHFQNASGTRLELSNVRNWTTNETFQSVQIYHRKDIRSVRRLPPGAATSPSPTESGCVQPLPANIPTADSSEEAITLPNSTSLSSSSASLSSSSPPSPSPSPTPPSPSPSPPPSSAASLTCRLSVDQLQRIRVAIRTPAYYPHTDRHYHAAVAALRRQSTVALSVGFAYRALRSEVGLLTLTGADIGNDAADDAGAGAGAAATVHIFDIASMGRIPDGLRHLLTAERPLKIVHDSTLATYVLHTVYDVRLAGLFDTRMAHATVGGRPDLVSLGAMLELYLRVPAAAVVPSSSSTTPVDWTARPLSAEHRQLAGQLVAYLPALYAHLLFDRMLGDFFASCARFAHEYTHDDYDDVDVACRVSMHTRVEPTGADGRERSCTALKPASAPRPQDRPLLPRLEELEL